MQTAHDVRLQLQWIAEGGSQAGVPAPVAARRRSRERLWMAAAVLFAASAAVLALLLARGLREPARILRRSVAPPEGASFWLDPSTPGPPVLSPDGRKLAFSSRTADGKVRLHVRPLDAFEARVFPGTEDAQYPFWSPDSRAVGFFAGGKAPASALEKIGIRSVGRTTYELADCTLQEYSFGLGQIEFMGEVTAGRIIFGSG